jgi:1,4-alpha-glucan branching enzyme
LGTQASGPKSKPAHLQFFRDGVNSVFVAGSFNDWQPRGLELQLGPAGNWEIDLCLPPGEYEYRFVVDGEWTDDPLAGRVVANAYGGVNAVLSVQGGG